MAVNITNIKTSSNGILEGDNALDTAFPLLIIQTTLILVVTRLLAIAFKPLRQPKVIAEIVGGILLGPSALGRNHAYLTKIFPSWSAPILESVASIGLLFFLFLVGLELDLSSIRQSGRQAFSIAMAGITLPFTTGAALAVLLRKSIPGADKAGYGPFLVFMGVSLSITAFPVLARILAELKLLTTKVGQTAMAAAAFNDVAAWILLALAVALSGNGEDGGGHKSPLISIWVLLCGVGFVGFMFVCIKPVMGWVARKCSSEHDAVDELYITMTLGGVLVCGFITDFIGIHSIFGAFIFGLVIPKEGGFAKGLIERIEDFVTGLLLPLYFASSGLKTDVTKIRGAMSWAMLVLVIVTACFGKIVGTFTVSLCCKFKVREALTLGVLMNTKGLVELIVLNIGKEKKVLNDEMFAILVLMALFTTFITTPIVMAIYKPARSVSLSPKRNLQSDQSQNGPNNKYAFKILACAHGPGNVSGLINLIESIRSTAQNSKLKLYIMHLVELTERSSSIVMVQKLRRNGLPFFNPTRKRSRVEVHDKVASAFETYAQLSKVMVKPVTVISPLSTMQQDICHVAEDKTVVMIILPFHKMWRKNEDSGEMEVENVGHGWRGVNQRVLKDARCSVGVFVDRGFDTIQGQRMCVVFFGGPDDREALELGGRMADHPAIKVSIIRFIESYISDGNSVKLMPSREKNSEHHYTFSVATMNRAEEKALDDAVVAEFRNKWEGKVEYTERNANNVEEQVVSLGKSDNYELIIVGKGRFPSAMVAQLADRHPEHAELGPIGDILSSSTSGVVSSLLVVQQHDLAHVEEVPVSKVVNSETDSHRISDLV